MTIAKRIQKLGTETAFAVSAEAAAFAAKGNKVYPFHLGDMNILTPANVMEAAIKAMRDGKTGYCPNAGIPQLREILAADVSASRGVPYTMENVAIQPGGKPTIGIFILALMNPGDEVLYDWVNARCEEQFSAYVGEPYEDSRYWIEVYFPTEGGWDEGDRNSLCTVVLLDEDYDIRPSLGSAKGWGDRAA